MGKGDEVLVRVRVVGGDERRRRKRRVRRSMKASNGVDVYAHDGKLEIKD